MVKRLIAVHVAFDARRLRGFVRWWTKKAEACTVISSPYLLCTAPTRRGSGIPIVLLYLPTAPMPANDDNMAPTTHLHSHPST
ncbi:hypothetical protein GGP41_005075 [Bipolaris sorokiniana]|uniref:Uncharacterized protein n=1 Tax=Cochliobolus sativus TaxID=45130 RepID=A0A8H5ZI31_COCSA|nr:hypothetical protein GGP41_005075 [Bipolaris sorokiniana]